MKKILILMTAFLFAIEVSNAQTEKGNQTLGVNLGFSYNKTNIFTINPFNYNSSSTQNLTTTNFNAGPNYSYFIADKLDIGTSLSYGTSKQTDDEVNFINPTKQTSNNYGATIYLRKYFMFQNKIGFRVGPSLGYSRVNSSVNNPISNATINNGNTLSEYTAGIGLGMVYFPSKKMGVSATIANLYYDHLNGNYINTGHQTQDSVNFRFINDGLSLSIFYVFGS